MSKNIPYPSDLGDIVEGLFYSEIAKKYKVTKSGLFDTFKNDKKLKKSLSVTNEQIKSAIDDCFTIHSNMKV